ncbi:VCBS repeat-containing protein [Streptomyces sp. NBC_01381]|uniref:FG-GAP repeat protein n=1 Tax=Streptomyces sp. NBC_01381 TaxID=2903845 RepID=UPI0022515A45|nr:hypothetical protein [Streptomyces sp. NBC_01381]MCX4670664.1 VCBS repeat-containing protein [Streptomyces sp. NBC_01381]
MTDRSTIPGTRALVVCAALALFGAGCGDGSATADKSPSASRDGNPVSTPSAGGPPPSGGKGSKDPDDINGDGHRDLLLPVPSRDKNGEPRTGVVFGSAKGLDPSTHAVYRYAPGYVTTVDLDGDGYPDFVSTTTDDVPDDVSDDPGATMRQEQPTVDWGGPSGPKAAAKPTRIQIPGGLSGSGLTRPVRGDFDGDGHHDIAALQQNGSVTLLYGPFTRSGAPARSDSRPGKGSWLAADDIVPSGKPRATGLLVHEGDDGEQSAGVLYPARNGSGLSRTPVELREGNSVAFGDYDGDGARDLAIGDDGSRNDEPGAGVEEPEVAHSYAVYPGKGGAPIAYKLPKSRSPYEGPHDYTSADPDGDGKDGLFIATADGALLMEGEGDRTKVLRVGPARANGKKIPTKWRYARPYAAADFDADGKEELVLNWSADGLFRMYSEEPTHWWITEGTSGRDRAAFATTSFPAPTLG